MKTPNSSTLKVRQLTKLERSQFTLSKDLNPNLFPRDSGRVYGSDILVGLLLGDLCAHKRKESVNAKLHFEQGLVHKDYLFHLYELFQSYCLTAPKISARPADKRTGNVYSRVKFQYC
jgi:hypothetical protein